jgi:hypothetical protein
MPVLNRQEDKMQLYSVTITRVILAGSLDDARKIAGSVDNPEDVELIAPIQSLLDIPQGWENAIPYGAGEQTTLECLFTQLAADMRFNGFEVHPCLVAGKDEHGQITFEQCDENDPALSVWSVYARLVAGGLECLANFAYRQQADEFRDQILKVQGMWAEADEYFAASGTSPAFAEDEHLESYFEDRISGGDPYGGQPLAEDW